MGYGDIRAHGNPLVSTPNFDSLYNQSARFTNFAVSPTCAPTRAALLTGKHEFFSGVTHTINPMRNLDTASVTIAELMRSKGYATGLFGKWHLGQSGSYGPWYRGFDETLTVPGDDQRSHFDPVLLKNGKEQQFKGYREDILFDKALNFIEANKDAAFFCYLATYSPHAPNVVPEKYSKPYEGYLNPDMPEAVFRPGFYGQIANIDENLGKLLAYLKAANLDENTLLVVLNDNGGTWGVDTHNSGRRGMKNTAWSGGTLAYSFWKWGNHFQPGERSQMSGHLDIFPTLVELCNLELSDQIKKELDGNSLNPVLKQPNASLDKSRMQVHHVGRWDIPENWADHKYAGATVRWNNYTLVRIDPCEDENCNTCVMARIRGTEKTRFWYSNNPDHYALTSPGQWELFNLQSDPFQENNIARENPEIVQKMRNYYENWWSRVEIVMKKRWQKS